MSNFYELLYQLPKNDDIFVPQLYANGIIFAMLKKKPFDISWGKMKLAFDKVSICAENWNHECIN